jgi:hypothetical protein
MARRPFWAAGGVASSSWWPSMMMTMFEPMVLVAASVMPAFPPEPDAADELGV